MAGQVRLLHLIRCCLRGLLHVDHFLVRLLHIDHILPLGRLLLHVDHIGLSRGGLLHVDHFLLARALLLNLMSDHLLLWCRGHSGLGSDTEPVLGLDLGGLLLYANRPVY